MTPLHAVADSSALIALNDIHLLDRIEPLFASLLVPTSVEYEISRSVALRPWMIVVPPTVPLDQRLTEAALDPGETEALAIALSLSHHVLVDEQRARRVALRLGIPVIGTVGLIIRAKQAGHIGSVREYLGLLEHNHFYLSAEVIETALRLAGEL